MGITIDEFFENIYSVIFSPKAFYENKELKISVRVAIGTIFFVAIVSKVAAAIADGSILMFTFTSSLLWHVAVTVFTWFLTALFCEYTAKIFSDNGNLPKILFYTAFAPIPYIFFAPLNIIKQLGTFGFIIASLSEFALYLWIITLYAYSIKATYNITLSRAFMMIGLPFVSVFFFVYWLYCFCKNIGYIFSM